MSTAEMSERAEPARDVDACPFCGTPAVAGQAFCLVCGQPGTPLRDGALLAGNYRVSATLSTSSTGAVYQAMDERRKRSVAIKELLAPPGASAADRAALATRFRREVKRLEHLKHPCLPEVYGGFVADGRLYLVMAPVNGKSLETTLVDRGRGYAERQVREWMSHMTALLEYFEERRPAFVHGEIRPSHLILDEHAQPFLVGFGLAPRLGLRPWLELPGQASGQAVAEKQGKGPSPAPITPRDDLYGLGATLHAALTGRDVFAGVDEPDQPYPPVREWAPRTSVGVAEIVNRAVSADPARRFPSALALRVALAPVLDAAAGTTAPAPGKMPPAARRALPLPLPALLAALAVLVIAATALYILFNQPAKTAREPAIRPTPARLATPVPPLPVPTHTSAVADSFLASTTLWPSGRAIYRRGGSLWLDDTAGSSPLKAVRAGYSTGKDGFDLRAVLRQSQGPADAAYGVVALDQPGSPANNVALLVRGTGAWSLVRTVAGHAAPLIDWRQEPAVRIGHNSPNELELRLEPGSATGAARAFVVIINGRRMTVTAPAGNVAAGGRVGLVAHTGALIVCDDLSVTAGPAPASPVDEHFLDNRRGWSSSASAVLANNLLRLRTSSRQPWGEVTTERYRVLPTRAALSEEALLGLSSKSTAPGTGGLVFARGAVSPQPGKPPVSEALAAVVDTNGKVTVFALTPGHSRVLSGPFASKSVRRGYGLNLIHVSLTRTRAGLQTRISVNGGKPLLYVSTLSGLQPATGIAVIGRDSTVVASAYRLFR